MIYSKRDFNMVLIMLGVLLLGLSYLIAAPRIEQWNQASALRERLVRDRSTAGRIISGKSELLGKIETMRGTLPRYGMTDPVGAELLRQVRRLADENRVITTRITPDAERSIGDLYEQSIEVTWEAGLDSLVRFLYAVQIAGATLDIRQMTITPAQGDLLKGNLKIFFAYQRLPSGTEDTGG